jgi:ribosomal protein L2
MSKINNLQVKPNQNVKYSRATGSYSVVLKKNTQFSSTIIKLPSGVRKIFSSFSFCTQAENQTTFKSFIYSSSSKDLVNKGLSPRSRGVAKNPVDHPHGGRTKALKYPRTP